MTNRKRHKAFTNSETQKAASYAWHILGVRQMSWPEVSRLADSPIQTLRKEVSQMHNQCNYPKKARSIVLSLMILVLAVSLFGCNILDRITTTQATTTTGSAQTNSLSGNIAVAIALDVSGSTNHSFARNVRDTLANRVADYIPQKPAQTKEGVTEIPGLRIAIYLINSKNPNAYNDPVNHNNLICEIKGIPGLAERPEIPADGATEGYIQAYSAWKDAQLSWSKAYDESLKAARNASDMIAKMNLSVTASGESSGIYNTICAVISALPDDKLNVGVFSDLLENGTNTGAPPTGKSGKVVFCVPSPDGNVLASQARCKALSAKMETWGFEQAITYNPDLLAEAVNTLFQ